jgi:hypothetical protein
VIKDLTDKEIIFLEVLFDETARGMPLEEAKFVARDAAGYVETTHPNSILRRLKDEINNRATEELAMKLPDVIQKVDGILQDPTQLGAKHLLEAATWIADRAGLVKKDQSTVTLRTEQGIIVMPPKKKIEMEKE